MNQTIEINLEKELGIDLSMVTFKMKHKKSEAGWTDEEIEKWKTMYLCFLFLHKKYPKVKLAPFGKIDTVWHYHILDTRAYKEDCEVAFGEYFHHYPYSGLLGKEDALNQEKYVSETKDLFKREFGFFDTGVSSDPCVGSDGCSGSACWGRHPS